MPYTGYISAVYKSGALSKMPLSYLDLGNAFLAQQSDAMDAVQRMRKKAQDKGNFSVPHTFRGRMTSNRGSSWLNE